MSADWASHVIWWQVYPLGFVGAEPEAVEGTSSRLGRIEAWLDHLLGLGANGLALGPVFASATHGYDTTDHFAVDSRLGTEDDLVHLVEACHARGIRVQLDGVFNHVGRGFAPFQDVLRNGAASEFASWFHLDFDASGPDGFGYRCFEGHDSLVTLNHDEPAVADHVARVLSYWCERGVDSWRLDAAYAVRPGLWARVLPGVRAQHPALWVSGEMIHGDYGRYVTESGIDSVTQYELWKAIWSALNDVNLFELAHALSRHDELLPTFLPQTFVGNHDVTRVASRLDDERHVALALAVLFAIPGVPSVYYGDEVGQHGVKEDRVGGDDAVRPAYPEVADEGWQSHPAYDEHRRLIGVRRRLGWVNQGRLAEPDVLSNQVLAFRVASGDRMSALVLNVGDDAAEVEVRMPAGEVAAGTGSVTTRGDGSVHVRVEGHGYVWLA